MPERADGLGTPSDARPATASRPEASRRATTEDDEDGVTTQSRLRGLLRANRLVADDLALPVVLQRIVESAAELAHAAYAALAVNGPDAALEQFIHVGIDDETAARIGHPPEGRGLLGALVEDPRPIRLRNLADDPRSVGFPRHHPHMRGFLGVPIRIRGEVYGNLFLSGRDEGDFTLEDEELVTALAVTAGTAIEHARLYDEARRRQQWLEASTEITRQLLTATGEDPLVLVSRRLADLAEADVVTLVLPAPGGDQLMVEVALGEHADRLTALTYPAEGTASGVAIRTGRPVLLDEGDERPGHVVHLAEVIAVGPVMAIPLVGSEGARGALLVCRLRGRRTFDEADLEMATTFASHATLALEMADLRASQERMLLLEDRDRIARDLHDHVIQRLFATGLTLQGLATGLACEDQAARLTDAVTELDDTIRQIRTSIFALRGSYAPTMGTTRQQLVHVVADHTEPLGFAPTIHFTGPVDAAVPEEVVDDLVATVREALTNVARHARAHCVAVDVAATARSVTVDVVDDGVGIGSTPRRSGLANLRRRAESRGGTFVTVDHEGTHLRWTVPLT